MAGVRDIAEALLLDLDGPLRVFDPSVASTVELEYALPAGALGAAAFAWPRLRPAIVGEVSHDEWMAGVVEDLVPVAGGQERAALAVAEWQRYRGDVSATMLRFIREVRRGGIPVGLATNATNRLDDDLAELALIREVDVVVNSSVLGVHKPAKEFFLAACQAIGRPPGKVLFLDDEDRNIRGARAAGLSAHRWTSVDDLPYLRAALNLR